MIQASFLLLRGSLLWYGFMILQLYYQFLWALTSSYPVLPALTRSYLLLIFGPYNPEQMFLEWNNVLFLTFKGLTSMLQCKDFQLTYQLLPTLTRFTVSYLLLLILKRSYPLLIFWPQYFPPPIFFGYKISIGRKKMRKQTQKNYWIYIFTRDKISTYGLCLGGSSLVGHNLYIQGDLDNF